MPIRHTPGIAVDVTEGFDTLDGLRAPWDEVFRSRRHEPSTSHEWTRAMVAHHVRPGDTCLLLTLRTADRVEGFVPLVCRDVPLLGMRIRVLAPLSEQSNTHSDLLVRRVDHATISSFVTALGNLGVAWDCFRMSALLEDEPLARELQSCLAHGRHRHTRRDGLPAYVLDLPASFDDYLVDRSQKFRGHLKRTTKKVESAGLVEVHTVATPHEFETAYDAVLTIERASWKDSHGSAITSVEHQAGFYRDFGRDALGANRLHLQWMTIDGRPVAYNLGFISGDTYHYLKTSYDAAFRSLGPSTWLRARLIRELLARQVRRLDFPGEPYEWERQWTTTLRWRQAVVMYGSTARGRLLQAVDRLRRRQEVRTLAHLDPRTGELRKARSE